MSNMTLYVLVLILDHVRHIRWELCIMDVVIIGVIEMKQVLGFVDVEHAINCADAHGRVDVNESTLY